MEPYKKFFVTFYSTQLNLNIINDTVKNKASSSDKEGGAKEKIVAQICGEITTRRSSDLSTVANPIICGLTSWLNTFN